MKKAASILFTLALACSGAQTGHTSKIAADAATTDTLSTVQVIVQWNIPIGEATAAKINALGGQVIRQFKSLQQGIYSVPGSAMTALDADPAVKYVSADRKVERKLATTAATINAPQVWASGFNGTGVGVAILDSGINQDDNLGQGPPSKVIVYTDDFTPSATVNGKQSKSFGQDWYGHGQHVAGIIASSGKASICGNCSKSMIGIAPGASLIDLKVLDSQGVGSDSQVIAAIDEAISLKDTYHIRVMNLSLGRPVYESYTQDPLCQAVESAWKAGIVVVVAAGNDGRDNSTNNLGYGTILAPGNDPYVITVGSMKTMNTPERSDDLIASYSSKGPSSIDCIVKPDLVAPGNLIVSLLAQHGSLPLTNPQNAVPQSDIQSVNPPKQAPTGGNVSADPTKQPPGVNFGGGYSNTYYILSGTSMAAAVVSGAVADILNAYPALTPDQVKILLMQTASKTFPTSSVVTDNLGNTYTDYYDIFTVGAGYLDLQAAIKGAPSVPASGNSLSPSSTYDSTSGNVYVSFDPSSAWANQSVWPVGSVSGARAVWSSSVLSGTRAVWSSNALWGASADSAQRSVWSSRSHWASSSDQSAADVDNSQSIEIAGEN
ncbi:MAG: S8 family serine peptidase [Acidobacteriaceae bacterium]|nr:S8 family serine peptidase [Acidobacteriaceae bacterium]